MSATLTPKRKSARDRPSVGHKVGGLGERKRGDIGASTEELVVSRPARIRVQIHTPKGGIEQPCIADPRRASCPAICRYVCRCIMPRCCCRPGAAPSPTRLSLLLSLLRKAPPLLHLWHIIWHIAGTCVARAHACVRYGAWAGCGAHSESTSSIASPPPRQPLLSGHKND